MYELVVPVGTYDLTVSADGYAEAEETALEVADGGVLTTDVSLHVGEASISGTVVDAETGDPVPDAELEVVEQVDVGQTDPARTDLRRLSRPTRTVRSTSTSHRVYEITVETLGYANGGRQNIELETGEQQSLDDIELASVPVLSGTVTDSETDEPIQGPRSNRGSSRVTRCTQRRRMPMANTRSTSRNITRKRRRSNSPLMGTSRTQSPLTTTVSRTRGRRRRTYRRT